MNELLQQFHFTQVLHEDSILKTIKIQGMIQDQPCILIIEKQNLIFDSLLTKLKQEVRFIHQNDIYHNYLMSNEEELKITLIYPATEAVFFYNS